MSSSALHIRSEEIDNIEKRGKYTVSIIGCKLPGITHAFLFVDAGFKVICVDADKTIVNNLAKGNIPFLNRQLEVKLRNYAKKGFLETTDDFKAAASQSDIIALTIPVKIDEKRKADYSDIENASKRLGSGLRHGSIFIIMSVTGLGIAGGRIKETLENTSGLKVGLDFGLAYSPIQVSNGHAPEKMANQKRIVSALDKDSLNAASTILETITKSGLRKIGNIKTAEAVVLFEAAQQDVNTALTNELAIFCEKTCVDYLEAQKFLNVNNCNMLPLSMRDNGKARREPYLLLEDAENLNLTLHILTEAREINEGIIKHAINLIKDALRSCEKSLRRARICLLGISQTPNIKASPKKVAKELAKMLEAKGAKVGFYDPYFSSSEPIATQYPFKKNLSEAVEGADCILILTGHDEFRRLNLKKFKVIMKMPAVIVDLEGVLEPCKVENEGFIYRGFGRGVWTK